MVNVFRDLPEHDEILETVRRAGQARASVDVSIGWQFGETERCRLELNRGAVVPTLRDVGPFASAMRRLPRPMGGSLSAMKGEAVLIVNEWLWIYRFAGRGYVYEISSADRHPTEIIVDMPMIGTLTDVASERPVESYERRKREKGRGMLPDPEFMTKREFVRVAGDISHVRYRIDHERHFERRPLVRREAA